MLKLLIALLIFLNMNLLFSGERDNHEDAIPTPNGQLMIIDMNARSERIVDNHTFIKTVPGLMEMLANLAKTNPLFALSIYKDLLNEEIWFYPGQLPHNLEENRYFPYTPPQVEHTIANQDLVILAIRRPISEGHDIFIGESDWNRTIESNKKCALLHESMHVHRPHSNVSQEAHHRYALTLTRYICERNGNVDKNELQTLIDRFGVEYTFPEYVSEFADIISYIMKPEGNNESKCMLSSFIPPEDLQRIRRGHYRWANALLAFNEERDPHNPRCLRPQSINQVFEEHFPELYQGLTFDPRDHQLNQNLFDFFDYQVLAEFGEASEDLDYFRIHNQLIGLILTNQILRNHMDPSLTSEDCLPNRFRSILQERRRRTCFPMSENSHPRKRRLRAIPLYNNVCRLHLEQGEDTVSNAIINYSNQVNTQARELSIKQYQESDEGMRILWAALSHSINTSNSRFYVEGLKRKYRGDAQTTSISLNSMLSRWLSRRLLHASLTYEFCVSTH